MFFFDTNTLQPKQSVPTIKKLKQTHKLVNKNYVIL